MTINNVIIICIMSNQTMHFYYLFPFNCVIVATDSIVVITCCKQYNFYLLFKIYLLPHLNESVIVRD